MAPSFQVRFPECDTFPLPSIAIWALQRVFIAPPQQGRGHDVSCARITNVMTIHGVSSSPYCILDGFYVHANSTNREFCASSLKSSGSDSNVMTWGFSSLTRVLSWPKAVEPKVKPCPQSRFISMIFGFQERGVQGSLSGISGATSSVGSRRNGSPVCCFGHWDVADP